MDETYGDDVVSGSEVDVDDSLLEGAKKTVSDPDE